VTGKDWEYNPLTVANQANDWIEGKQYGVATSPGSSTAPVT
jgi:hypothetical protein